MNGNYYVEYKNVEIPVDQIGQNKKNELLQRKISHTQYLFIYLFIYLFFIYSWLTANEITVYNKNSYVYIHANNWRQLPNVEKMKNCKLNIKKKKKKNA